MPILRKIDLVTWSHLQASRTTQLWRCCVTMPLGIFSFKNFKSGLNRPPWRCHSPAYLETCSTTMIYHMPLSVVKSDVSWNDIHQCSHFSQFGQGCTLATFILYFCFGGCAFLTPHSRRSENITHAVPVDRFKSCLQDNRNTSGLLVSN